MTTIATEQPTSILYAMGGALWVNHPLRVAAADYKPAQLALAQRLGLTVPPTLVTNDPDEARQFISAHDQVIYKTLRWTPYQRDGIAVTGWADPVTAAEIDESLRVAPHLFQAVVDKVADLRILIVGRQVFAVRITSGLLDWRKDYSALSYSVVDLPAEIGTGTGYSAALMCHRLGEDNVTTVEVDPEVATRADAALEAAGYSTWTVTGDGLLGHPRRAPYDRVIATCAVRRIPYTWVQQTKPGGIILATVGSWANGAGLAKVTVNADGTAEGRIIGQASFMQARSQAAVPVAGDLSARTAYADSERQTKVSPLLFDEWMPAFLAQVAAPGAQLVRATTSEGRQLIHLFDPERESFAEISADGEGWRVRQGGPIPLWDAIEEALTAWQAAGRPGIDAVQLRVSQESHLYWIEGSPALRWEHRLG